MSAAVQTLPAQLPAYAPPLFQSAPYKVLYGGRGGGRSWTVARALLILAAARPLRILCTREYQTAIRDSVHQLLRDQIALLGLTGFSVTHTEITHTNGSLFLFEGLRYNVSKVKSLEGIDICWVEEAERISKDSWDVLEPTIRKPGSEIWITFNPDLEEDATFQKFVAHPPPRAWIKKVSWRDNPWFTKELKEKKDHAFSVDAESATHIWDGEFRRVSNAQILKGKWSVQEFTPFLGHTDKADCKDLQNRKQCSHAWGGPYQGMDFGFAEDPAAAVRSWVHEDILYVEYEMFRLHLDIDYITDAVNADIPDFDAYVTRADSSRPDSISYLKRHGLPRILGAKKGPGSVEDGVAHLRQYKKIIIHPRCVNFKDECKRYSYKVDERSLQVLPIIVDAHNHLMDSERYALEPMIKPQRRVGVLFADPNPVPTNGNGNGNARGKPHLIGINSR